MLVKINMQRFERPELPKTHDRLYLDGGDLAPEDLAAQMELLDRQVVDISRQEVRTEDEYKFINRLVDLGSRNLIYWLERYNRQIPNTADTPHILGRLRTELSFFEEAAADARRTASGASNFTPEELQNDRALMVRFLEAISQNVAITPVRPATIKPAEETARGLLQLTKDILKDGELPMDAYISGNLRNIIDWSERAKAA